MNRTGKVVLLIAVAVATLGSVCDDEEGQITGTYSVVVFEGDDTCDDSQDSYGAELVITQQGDGYSVTVNGAGPLTGDIREDGILAVSGTITETDGTRPRQVRLEMDIRRGRIVEGEGEVTWDGTFPEVPGVCRQELFFTGSRLDVAPVLG